MDDEGQVITARTSTATIGPYYLESRRNCKAIDAVDDRNRPRSAPLCRCPRLSGPVPSEVCGPSQMNVIQTTLYIGRIQYSVLTWPIRCHDRAHSAVSVEYQPKYYHTQDSQMAFGTW